MMMAISAAMTHIHMKNILHRDLKPSNIIIDKNQMPKINDFWNARKISKKKPMTRMIGTLNVMAPEVMTEHTYGKSADVYSYGSIFYFVCEGRLSFQELKTKDLICAVSVGHQLAPFMETPENIQNLVTKCWDPNPSQRPSFINICNMIARGIAAFPGSDVDDLIQAGKKMVQEQKRRNLTMPHTKSSLYNTFNSTNNVSLQSINMNTANMNPKNINSNNTNSCNMNNKYNINTTRNQTRGKNEKDEENPFLKFKNEFSKANLDSLIKIVTPSNFDSFFKICSNHLNASTQAANSQITSINSTNIVLILRAIEKLCNREIDFLDSMCYSGFFELPLLRDSNFIECSFNITKLLMIHKPNMIMPYMRPLFKFLIESKSSDMILLFSIAATSISKIRKPLAFFDIILNSYEVYINKDYGTHFIRLIYHLIKESQTFKENRFQEIQNILSQFLQSHKESVLKETYFMICQIYSKEFLIPFDVVFQHLQITNLQEIVISLILRIETYPIQRRVANGLIQASKMSSRAALALFKYAEQQNETAFYLCTKCTAWMRTGLSNPVDTYKLTFILYSKPIVRAAIGMSPDFPYLLNYIVNQRNEFALTSLSMIIKATFHSIINCLQNQQNSQNCLNNQSQALFAAIENSNFFDYFFKLVVKSNSKRITQAAFVVLDTIARVSYSPNYNFYLPKLIEQISKQNELSFAAIQILVILSQYVQCHDSMKNLGIVNYFKSMENFPDFTEIANTFLKNIEKSNGNVAQAE